MIAVDTNILVYAHREDAEWRHGVTELRFAARDFGRFPELTVANQLLARSAEGAVPLEPAEKRQVLQVLDAFIERGKLKKKIATG